jgi:hypothetical protein
MDAVTNSSTEVIDFLQRQAIPLRLPHDHKPLADAFKVEKRPCRIILDQDGHEHHRSVGFLSPEELIATIRLGMAKTLYDDLWEERRGIFSFTVAAVFGGLTAASLFCEVFGEREKAQMYRKAASDIRDGASRYLWRDDLGRFCRMIQRTGEGSLEVDGTCDSSLWGFFAFGVYKADDPRITATMNALRERLWVSTPTGGMARYENDEYHRVSRDVTGNPWFISTLWLADYLISVASDREQLKAVEELLLWAAHHTLQSGVMAEQINPHTGEPLSVSPLTWSHATFVSTTQRYMIRLAEIESGKSTPRHEDWIGRLFAETCGAIHGACKVK